MNRYLNTVYLGLTIVTNSLLLLYGGMNALNTDSTVDFVASDRHRVHAVKKGNGWVQLPPMQVAEKTLSRVQP